MNFNNRLLTIKSFFFVKVFISSVVDVEDIPSFNYSIPLSGTRRQLKIPDFAPLQVNIITSTVGGQALCI